MSDISKSLYEKVKLWTEDVVKNRMKSYDSTKSATSCVPIVLSVASLGESGKADHIVVKVEKGGNFVWQFQKEVVSLSP